MLNILLADDHELIRAGLKQVLQAGLGPLHVGEAENVPQALSLAEAQPWDIALTDLTLPGHGRLDLLKEFKMRRPDMPVLVLSMLSENEVAIRVLKSGAAGFIHKETSGEELMKAVRKVLAGGKYVSESLAEKLALYIIAPPLEEPHRKLSNREFAVMTMLASGKTLTEIGKMLALSIKTISTYRTRVLLKMQLENNSDLTRYALKHRLME